MRIKKNHKGISAGGCLGLIVLIGLIIALVIFLLNHFGLGFGGGGDGDGDGEENAAPETSSVQEVEPAVVEYAEVEVIIKGDRYSFNGGEYELEPLITELKKSADENKNLKVNITQDNGLADALDALTEKLEAEGITYADNTAEADTAGDISE